MCAHESGGDWETTTTTMTTRGIAVGWFWNAVFDSFAGAKGYVGEVSRRMGGQLMKLTFVMEDDGMLASI